MKIHPFISGMVDAALAKGIDRFDILQEMVEEALHPRGGFGDAGHDRTRQAQERTKSYMGERIKGYLESLYPSGRIRKSRGQPCKQGETTRSGCIPAKNEGKGGDGGTPGEEGGQKQLLPVELDRSQHPKEQLDALMGPLRAFDLQISGNAKGRYLTGVADQEGDYNSPDFSVYDNGTIYFNSSAIPVEAMEEYLRQSGVANAKVSIWDDHRYIARFPLTYGEGVREARGKVIDSILDDNAMDEWRKRLDAVVDHHDKWFHELNIDEMRWIQDKAAFEASMAIDRFNLLPDNILSLSEDLMDAFLDRIDPDDFIPPKAKSLPPRQRTWAHWKKAHRGTITKRARSNWNAIKGPRGGKIWVNSATGRQTRSDPTRGWKDSGYKATPRHDRPSVDEVHGHMQAAFELPHELSPEKVHHIKEGLLALSVTQMRELKERLGVKASGLKAELAKKITHRAAAKARTAGQDVSNVFIPPAERSNNPELRGWDTHPSTDTIRDYARQAQVLAQKGDIDGATKQLGRMTLQEVEMLAGGLDVTTRLRSPKRKREALTQGVLDKLGEKVTGSNKDVASYLADSLNRAGYQATPWHAESDSRVYLKDESRVYIKDAKGRDLGWIRLANGEVSFDRLNHRRRETIRAATPPVKLIQPDEAMNATPPEKLGFTGIDAQGREWRDGELVPQSDESGNISELSSQQGLTSQQEETILPSVADRESQASSEGGKMSKHEETLSKAREMAEGTIQALGDFTQGGAMVSSRHDGTGHLRHEVTYTMPEGSPLAGLKFQHGLVQSHQVGDAVVFQEADNSREFREANISQGRLVVRVENKPDLKAVHDETKRRGSAENSEHRQRLAEAIPGMAEVEEVVDLEDTFSEMLNEQMDNELLSGRSLPNIPETVREVFQQHPEASMWKYAEDVHDSTYNADRRGAANLAMAYLELGGTAQEANRILNDWGGSHTESQASSEGGKMAKKTPQATIYGLKGNPPAGFSWDVMGSVPVLRGSDRYVIEPSGGQYRVIRGGSLVNSFDNFEDALTAAGGSRSEAPSPVSNQPMLEAGTPYPTKGQLKRGGEALAVSVGEFDRILSHHGGTIEGKDIEHAGQRYRVTGTGNRYKGTDGVMRRYLYLTEVPSTATSKDESTLPPMPAINPGQPMGFDAIRDVGVASGLTDTQAVSAATYLTRDQSVPLGGEVERYIQGLRNPKPRPKRPTDDLQMLTTPEDEPGFTDRESQATSEGGKMSSDPRHEVFHQQSAKFRANPGAIFGQRTEHLAELGGQPALRTAIRKMEALVSMHGEGEVGEVGEVGDQLWEIADGAVAQAAIPTEEEFAELLTNQKQMWIDQLQTRGYSSIKRAGELTWGEQGYQDRLDFAVFTATAPLLSSLASGSK